MIICCCQNNVDFREKYLAIENIYKPNITRLNASLNNVNKKIILTT